MLPDPLDLRSRPDPFGDGAVGVEVVQRATGGIPTVQGIDRRLFGRLIGFHPDLSVGNGFKGLRLENHPGYGVGEFVAVDAIENPRPHGHLSHLWLSPGLGIDCPGQQIEILLGDPRC